MECSWDSALLQHVGELPAELLEIIKSGNNEQYLEALTKTSLDPRHTYLIFAHTENIFAHICASLRKHGTLAASVAVFGRIVDLAPYLQPFATNILETEQYDFNASLSHDDDLLYLLGLFRLLCFDPRSFAQHVDLVQTQALFRHECAPVRYLAVRILQICLDGADHWFEDTLKQVFHDLNPSDAIIGKWDDREIDYRFLSLWEEQRLERMEKLRESADVPPAYTTVRVRILSENDLNPATALVGRVVLPRHLENTAGIDTDAPVVLTSTVASNIVRVSAALRSTQPLLLTGLAGSGKTTLVRHVAHRLRKLDKMVSLHLNEQSDAKLLIGIYTTNDTPGSFIWRPGVLTTAVQEGRWVLIEDLDRAPNEIIGTLLPLIERRELLIPNRQQTIQAAPGLRIIATVRSSINPRGDETRPLSHMLGVRHWQNVMVETPPIAEQKEIALQLYPALGQLLPQFMSVYDRLQVAKLHAVLVGRSKTGITRAISPRDLFKWCARVTKLLQQHTSFTSKDLDDIFMEAVDCFVGALPDGPARLEMAAAIAKELNIDPQRRDYLLSDREVKYEADKQKIVIGRYSLPRTPRDRTPVQTTFSTNSHTTRMLERVTAAVLNREPLLLVGETGVGKTTAVQHLAHTLNKKLEPFNLSQQSEAGDLLGGFKPITPRNLVVPMKDEFDDLFHSSFSMSKNQQFLELLGKQMAKSNWKAVCKLWYQALKMVDQQRAATPEREGEAPKKKRKVDSKKTPDFPRWDVFAAKVKDLERRLSAGSEGFAFSFVEGNIVKAVRNGDWVLLDEINLASPDTLEAIADLLDPAFPSLLLTEAGNIERIQAHPDFRVFAAMNPATDIGKKDLPPGIRSRFTELYVESPDKDIKSLQAIVRSYLRADVQADPAVALDVSTLYQKILALSDQNKLVDGAGQHPHFSLRTLTRTLSYAKYIAPQCNTRRAVYEGFQMSFLTFLDAESEKLVQPLLEQHLLGKRMNIRSELQKALRQPSDGHQYIQGYLGSKHWVRQGSLPPQEQTHYILTPFIKRNLENLVRASSTRQFPVLIQGPTSSGKTSMIEYLAKRTGHKFVRINNHEHTDLQEYLGTYISGADGKLTFQEGILVRALKDGHWIVLDELNLAPTDVLEALNRLLDDNRELLIPETQEVVRPHASFMLFATQNPAGLYGGRKTLSRAFRNRFLELHFDDIPIDELQEILHKRTQLPESRCKRIVTVYRELSVLRQANRVFEQKSFATLRDLFRWASRPNDTIEQLANNGFMLLAERVRKPEERQALKDVLQKVMSAKGPKVKIDEDVLYAQGAPEIRNYTAAAQLSGVVWTKAMRRLYVLVARAIQNDEPVLLVGETGCGKTTVCQMLADALRKVLHTINAHQNTETGDLIGSQRPVRNRGIIEAELRSQLLASTALQNDQSLIDESTDALLEAYDSAAEQPEYTSSEMHIRIQGLRTRYRALFEWADGSLLQAMKEGAFFLLDEISLADDSVLERINSVLESSRSILLAEKGSLDSFVTAKPGFQFFATMNPGGDYGKRELSPALRNRFTEIWVPALSDTEDVVQIVSAKLSLAAKSYAEAMVAFATWFKDRYNTSATSAVSVRDALAWVQFVNVFADVDAAAAIVHGAAMVYIDTLGANPAGLMTLTGRSLEYERKICLLELARLVRADAPAIYSTSVEVMKTDTALTIGSFSIPSLSSGSHLRQNFTFDAQTTRKNAMRVLRAMQLSKPVMLEGSPGVGKTALVTAIADAAGMPLTRINLSEQTDLLDLFGSDAPVEGAATGTFQWRDAPFLRAMKTGEWVLLDEMNLASQSVLEGLNACLDHRGEIFVPELGQVFSRHPDFRLFAAQNPHHQGGGRKGLPASFVNRFTVVYADAFGSDDLYLICRRSFPAVNESVLQQAIKFVEQLDVEVVQHRRFGASGGPWEFNLRDISRWLGLLTSDKGLLKSGNALDFVDFLFAQRFRSPHDREFVRHLLASVVGETLPRADVFSSVSTLDLQLGLAVLPRHPHDAPAQSRLAAKVTNDHLRVLESVMLCVQQGWPVILIGLSGSGKTSTIERLAACVGASLSTIALNAETDAMDLIGGYEQLDPLRKNVHALGQLRSRLRTVAKTTAFDKNGQRALQALDLLQHCAGETIPGDGTLQQLADLTRDDEDMSQLLRNVRNGKTLIDKARFSWTDGVLVDALQHGKWVVLDNANLCSASVLDRLNGLLEPKGTLVINEHTEADGSPRVIRPHPNFRIFLTVDPRYGELSRAMRNRAVELFIPLGANAVCLDPLRSESTMARFQQMKALGAPSPDEPAAIGIMVAADHLGLINLPLAPSWQMQVRNGIMENLQDLAVTQSSCHDMMAHYYQAATSQAQTSADFARVQTLHPLNNQALVQQSQHLLNQALLLALVHDLCNAGARLIEMLKILKMNRAAMRQLDHLERSWRTKVSSRGAKPSLLGTLEQLISFIFQWLQKLLGSTGMSVEHISATKCFLRRFYALSQYFMDAAGAALIDSASLASWLLAGQVSIHEVVADDGSPLQQMLSTFDESFRALSPQAFRACGRAFVNMWKALKPVTPKNMAQLASLLDFEQLVDRFDAVSMQFKQPLAEIAGMRVAFTRALQAAAMGSDDVAGLALKLQGLLLEGASADEEGLHRKPHFAGVFDGVCRMLGALTMSTSPLTQDSLATIELLAGRSTKFSLLSASTIGNGSSKSSAFHLLAAVLRPGTATEASGRQWPHLLLVTANSASTVAIGDLQLLESEVAVLGQVVAGHAHVLSSDHLSGLDTILEHLFTAVLESLANCNDDIRLQAFAATMLEHLSGRVPADALSVGVGEVPDAEIATSCDTLLRVARYLRNSSRDGLVRITEAANIWTAFAIACISLYVPGQPFDPALQPIIEREIHRRATQDLSQQLHALRTFRHTLTGEFESLRARKLEEDIQSLGQEPAAEEVCRPEISEIEELQGELNGLMRALKPVLQNSASGQSLSVNNTVLVNNVERVRSRLSRDFRAYDDITAPVVWFIDCLRMGQELQRQVEGAMSSREASRLAELVPFAKARASQWVGDIAFVENLSQSETQEEVMFQLSIVAARGSIRPLSESSPAVFAVVEQYFVRLYDQWKLKLSEEQRKTAAKSSLYRYRGDEDLAEGSPEELNALFPSYEEGVGTPVNTQDIQSLAPELAALHSSLFSTTQGPDEPSMWRLLERYATLASSGSCGTGEKEALPASILVLHQLNHKQATKDYNIYTDANVDQIKKLAVLLERIDSRFRVLHAAWPEHATPVEVIRLVRQIMSVAHSEPLTRLLPMVEKLHATVTQWQQVASREYSVSEHLDEVTTLIVSWRQLELSSWAGLLNRETINAHRDANAWWFVAFENIIVASQSLLESPAQLKQHAEGLFSTLEAFVLNCGLGEYATRLSMLRDFVAHLAISKAHISNLEVVHQALSNFVAYYSHFEAPVAEKLSAGRAGLEKDIKNVIQVASWKDRNVEVLKQSAKSSHNRLLRLVRKYRFLLAQPVAAILQSGVPNRHFVETREILRPARVDTSIGEASHVPSLSPKFPAWIGRPDRFVNIDATANLVRAKATRALTAADGADRVASFAAQLNADIFELQKATPSTLTDENKQAVQHLKGQKRRLLADVLKELRLMGFQSNLSQDVLSNQGSLSAVLAHAPTVGTTVNVPGVEEAEYHLHRFLGLMPMVRESSRKHSDDLTSAESARCLALLESMLQTSVSQGRALSQHIRQMTGLSEVLQQYEAFALCPDITTASTANEQLMLTARVNCVSIVLTTAARLVEAQASLAGKDYSGILARLAEQHQALQQLAQELLAHPRLPAGLQSSLECNNEAQFESIKTQVQSIARGSIQEHPELQPVLSHLQLWSGLPLPTGWHNPANGNDATDIDSVVGTLLCSVDQMLGSIRALDVPTEQDGRKGWLLQQFQVISKHLEAIRMDQIAAQLGSWLRSLCHVQPAGRLVEIVHVCRSLQPVVLAYTQACDELLVRSAKLHQETNRMAYQMASSFIQVAQQGFCSPPEKVDSKDQQAGDVEAGTGLGDGEGADDISKDVGNDEDLSELAQQPKAEGTDDEIEDSKDAVDMADEELEGQMGDQPDAESENGEKGDEKSDAGEDMDEEAGDVDDLGPSALDEKMWDEGKDDKADEREGGKSKGSQKEDDMAAGSDEKDRKETQEDEDQADDDMQAAGDEDENVERPEPEKTDPHADEQQNLELPDDMNMEGQKEDDNESLPGLDDSPEQEITDNMTAEEANAAEEEDARDQGAADEPTTGDMEDGEDGEDEAADPAEAGAQEEEQLGEDGQSDVLMQDREEDAAVDKTDQDVFGESGTGADDNESGAQNMRGAAEQDENTEGGAEQDQEVDAGATGAQQGKRTEDAETGTQEKPDDQSSVPYTKIGDALDEWYKQHQRIEAAREGKEEQGSSHQDDMDMANARFEHLPDEEAAADTQALGAASADQSKALDEDSGLPVNDEQNDDLPPANEQPEKGAEAEEIVNEPHMQPSDTLAPQDTRSAFIGETSDAQIDVDMPDEIPAPDEDTVEDVDTQLNNTHLEQDAAEEFMSIEEARALWSEHESNTRNLALVLTEHLRLILQPTQATKMRGDFRTGKRLNIKRIIPYIASSYKRDKIWMRRSVPSKRSYQIMLAIDDSKSMAESDSRGLAFETLALVAKAMSMLEVGELCVLGFGETTRLAHDFGTPFTTEAGAEVFKTFTFSQTKTNVRKLLTDSIELFRSARLKAAGSASELWQLQLIISDGVCEDHPTVRQLVRQAHEERIMVVFIVVDAAAQQAQTEGVPKQSILDLQTAEFVKDAAGEMQLKMVKYLDTFPFSYYLIVRDVHELPSVLAGALRQWFAEVVEGGGGM
ncbi:midasin (AAA ATPase) [Teratosphaeria destructans]|uniref:Midasin n=1 Tax=Teratosphaeria destructans TaxID=418781 RepID=A0A9W7SS89_9PEZI|nr:midasin (AAA ATPase) [Teratosphaeria destructans]